MSGAARGRAAPVSARVKAAANDPRVRDKPPRRALETPEGKAGQVTPGPVLLRVVLKSPGGRHKIRPTALGSPPGKVTSPLSLTARSQRLTDKGVS
jgi:hypothetical protein